MVLTGKTFTTFFSSLLYSMLYIKVKVIPQQAEVA
jgi:hypothetical protein